MGRRVLCNPNFRLYLSSRECIPAMDITLASMVNIVNYNTSPETLEDDLLHRSFARLRPDLFSESRLANFGIQLAGDNMHQLLSLFRQSLGMNFEEKKQSLAQLDVSKVSQAMKSIKDVSDII